MTARPVRAVAAPVFEGRGDVALVLLTVGFPSNLDERVMTDHGKRLRAAADRVTRTLGGDTWMVETRVQRQGTFEARPAGLAGERDARHTGD